MIVSLEAAAHEAALEDGVLTGYGQNRNDDVFKSKKAGLRRGKWTTEEESYANRLIYEFKLGLLPLTDGTTLRTFLSKLLNCDPMRISKKFVGANCIGKQVFRRRQQDLEKLSVEQIEQSRKELSELERRFLERVAQTNRTRSAPKEGRMAGYDEEGGLAPWMIQPEDNDQMSISSSSVPSSNYQGFLSGQALVQQRLQQQQQQLGQFQNGYQNFNSLDYGYNQQPTFPNQIDNGYNQKSEGQTLENSSVISKENSVVKVKAGKITSGLYGGNDGGSSMISNEQAYIDNNSKPNNRLHDYYYDGASNHSNQHNSNNNNSNNNNKSSLVHSINGMKIDDPNSLNRVNSLEMLCSLDMVKFSQNQSLDNMANFVLPSSQAPTSFPWFGHTTSGIATVEIDPNHGHNHNNNNNNSFDNNMKISASSVSLSDFAMSLWPSMNNLVTAAEAALSNNHNITDHQQFNVSPVLIKNNHFKMSNSNDDDTYSNKNKIKSNNNSNNNLGSLTKLQSLSNVALDELEAIATLEEENKTKEQCKSNLNVKQLNVDNKIDSNMITTDNDGSSLKSSNTNTVFNEIDQKPDVHSSIVVAGAEGPVISNSDHKSSSITIPSHPVLLNSNENNNNNNNIVIKVEKSETNAVSLPNDSSINEQQTDKQPTVESYAAVLGATSTNPTTLTTANSISPVLTTFNRSKLDSAPTGASATSHSSSLSMPMPNQLRHNSSVENFWMLVNMGDLPQPDNDVLSETLWPSMHQTHHDGDDNSTVKSMHSQNSHGSRKRNLGESDNNSNTSNGVNYNNNNTNKPTSSDLSRMQGSSNSSQVSAVSAMIGANEHRTKVKKILQIAASTKNNTLSSINSNINKNTTDDNEYNTDSHHDYNPSSNNSLNEKVINQMPFTNGHNSFNAVLNSVKSVTNNNNQDVTENNGREAIFSSQLQKLYFPINSNHHHHGGNHNNNLNSVDGNHNSVMDTSS